MLEISKSIYAVDEEDEEDVLPSSSSQQQQQPDPPQCQEAETKKDERPGNDSDSSDDAAPPVKSDKFVPVPVKTEILDYLERHPDGDEEEEDMFMRSIFEQSQKRDMNIEEGGANNNLLPMGSENGNSLSSDNNIYDDNEDEDDADWTAGSKKKTAGKGKRGRPSKGGTPRKRKRTPKVPHSQLPKEKLEAERQKAKERMRMKRAQQQLEKNLEVAVKLEPTSENEENEEDYSQFDEVVRPKRGSRRAAAENVKREQYRELDSDDDDDGSFETYQPSLELEEKAGKRRPRGRPPKVTRQVSNATRSSKDSNAESLSKIERKRARDREWSRKNRERKQASMTELEKSAEKARLTERRRQQREEKRSRSAGSGSLGTKTERSSDNEIDEQTSRDLENMMTKEERDEMIKARNRENTRKYREQKQAAMSEDELKSYKRKLAERRLQLLRKQRSGSISGSVSTKTEPSSDNDDLNSAEFENMMTKEERAEMIKTKNREKLAERKREQREKNRSRSCGSGSVSGSFCTKTEPSSASDDDDDYDDEDEEDSQKRKRTPYKPISEMTEDEKSQVRSHRRLKTREGDRIRKMQKRQSMTPEEREELLRKQREQKRARRAAMSAEEKEKLRQIEREKKKLKRKNMTPEEKREEAQKKTMRRIELLAQMTDEERAQYKQSRYFHYLAQKATLTADELLRRKLIRKEKSKARYHSLSDEQKKIIKERQKQWRNTLTGERRQRYLDKLKEAYNRRVDRLKKDPIKWGEMQLKVKAYKEKRKEFDNQKRPNLKRRKMLPCIPGESKEERSQRLLENRKLRDKKQRVQRKFAIQNLLDSGLTMEEIRCQMETREQREQRLIKARINFAKRNLRQRLSQHGAPADEIDARIEEFVASYQPRREFRPYKPRPDNQRPLKPEDLELLKDVQLQGDGEDVKPFAPLKPRQRSTIGNTSKRGRGRPKTTPQVPTQPQTGSSLFAPTLTSTPIATSAILGHARPQVQPQSHFLAFNSMSQMGANGANTSTYSASSMMPSPSSSTASGPPYPSTSSQVQQPYEQHHHGHQYVHNLPQDANYYYQSQQQAYNMHQNTIQNYSSQQPNLFDAINTFQTQIQTHNQNQPSNHPAHHQDDYSSSTGYDAPYGDDDHLHGGHSDDDNEFIPPPAPAPKGRRGRGPGRPKNSSETPNKSRRTRNMPRRPFQGRDPKVKRDQICEICGNAYTIKYINDHKAMHHSPYFVDGKCTLCEDSSVTYPSGNSFFKHYTKFHKQDKYVRNDGKKRDFVCVTCGEQFRSMDGLEKHEYYRHGEGSKKENYKKCPHCDKPMKSQLTLSQHIKKIHGGLGLTSWTCLRCDQALGSVNELKDHVRDTHPESNFPCEDCQVLKYTKASLMFHQNYCPKRPSEKKRAERKKEEKYVGIERLPSECEICKKSLTLFSLSRHYKETHGVIDELFTCLKCPKKFKRREWWVTHMEMVHSISPEDIKEEIAKYNVSDRDNVKILNYGRRNVKVARGEGKKAKRGGGGGRGRGGGRGGGGAGRGRRRTQRRSHSSEEEEEEEEEEESELEVEDSADDDDQEERTNSKRGRKSGSEQGRSQRYKNRQPAFAAQLENIEKEKRLVISIEKMAPELLLAFVKKGPVEEIVVEPKVAFKTDVKVSPAVATNENSSSEEDDDDSDSDESESSGSDDDGAQAQQLDVLNAAVASIANLEDVENNME